MSVCLKIGNRLLNGDQIISTLVQYKLLETLVGQVLLDEAIKDVPLSKQELFRALMGATDTPIPEDFDGFLTEWCQRQGVTSTYLRDVMLRELRVEKFKQLYFADQVESEFLRNKSNFDQIEYSLIRLTDLSLAQELYFQLRDDGTDFAQLAQQYAIGKERETEGRVGPVPVSTLPPEVITLLRREQPGTVCPPLTIGEQYWVVRLERFTVAQLTNATRTNLIEQLYTQWLQSQVKELLATPGAIGVQVLPPEASQAVPESVPAGTPNVTPDATPATSANQAVLEDAWQ